MSLTASATSRVNAARSILACSCCDRRGGLPCLRAEREVVIAVLADRASIAERLRFADAAAVEDLDVGGERPHLARKQRAELRFHFLRILAAGNAYPVRDAQHVAIDRQARDAERVTEHDVGRLAADARKRRQLFHVGRYFAAVF